MYASERQARKETEERNQIQHTIKMAQALKHEEKIKKEATLARAEKDKLMASSFSKLADDHPESNSVFRGDKESLSGSGMTSGLGGKRSRKEMEELEEAKRERDEIRREMRKANERNRRLEQAGKNKTKQERDNDRDISEKIALG